MLTVATYWWAPDEGSKFGHPYTPDDIYRLQRQVARHLTVPHEFACITDRPGEFGGAVRPVQVDWTTHVPGRCFVRLQTFAARSRETIGETVLQMDIDTLVVGNIDHVASRDENLVMWRNPARVPWSNPRIGRPLYNTSLLLHRPGTMVDLWAEFDPDNPSAKDDQWYLSEMLGKDWPYFDGARDGVYRLARADTPGSGVDGALPDNACIVTFPGSEGKWTEPHIAAANPWIADALG